MKDTQSPSPRGSWWKAEAGYTITFQAIYYIALLFSFFGMVYDFGNAGYVATIASNSVRMAAQDAAKNIDVNAFINNQEIRLDPELAKARAQEMVNGLTGGKLIITNVKVSSLQARDVIVVQGYAVAALPVLGSLFGLNSVTIPVEAYAEPAYGISQEGQ